jgi:hypothetical protein
MSEKTEAHPIAVLRPPRSDDGFILFALAVCGAFDGNLTFPSPDPTLPVFRDHITQLQDAQVIALSRPRGAASARDAKKKRVWTDLKQLCAYAQKVADAMASPADARAAITSVFLSIKKTAMYAKPPLAARNTGVSGTVALSARSVGRDVTYYWEHSADGLVWVRTADTLKGKTKIEGLTPATTYFFRFSALTRKGPVGASQVVSLLVH